MSIIYLNWAFSLPLTGSCKAVLVALADRADDKGFCYPSLDTIARRAGCSRMSVIRAVDRLKMLGYLEKVKEKGRSNSYFLKQKLSTETSNTGNTELLESGYPQVTQCEKPVTQCYEGSNKMLPDPSNNHQEPKKRAREGGSNKPLRVYPGQWNDNASFRPYTPTPATKAERKTVAGELRSIKSILGARA